jgi:hypothetical protein
MIEKKNQWDGWTFEENPRKYVRRFGKYVIKVYGGCFEVHQDDKNLGIFNTLKEALDNYSIADDRKK